MHENARGSQECGRMGEMHEPWQVCMMCGGHTLVTAKVGLHYKTVFAYTFATVKI
jgi:ribosomal protein L32